MTAKPQTKSNARRSAGAATRRTGTEHNIVEVDGGWAVVAAADGSEDATPGTSPCNDLAVDEVATDTSTSAPTEIPASLRGGTLLQAARAVLDAYKAADDDALSAAMDYLATTLARPAHRAPGLPRRPRTNTKQARVLALLRRDEGGTIAQIVEATGWQQHTVRGFLAGLKKQGIAVAVLDRIRQVGPNQRGAKGSYSIYRIAEAA